jgi:hypothetical protein
MRKIRINDAISEQRKGWIDYWDGGTEKINIICSDDGLEGLGIMAGVDPKTKGNRIFCKKCKKIWAKVAIIISKPDSSGGDTVFCFDPNWWVCPNGCNLDSIEKYITRTKIFLYEMESKLNCVVIKSISTKNPKEGILTVTLGCSKCLTEWECETNSLKNRARGPDVTNDSASWACPNGCNEMDTPIEVKAKRRGALVSFMQWKLPNGKIM